MASEFQSFIGSPLAGLAHLRDYKTVRASSFDRSGGNKDYIRIEPKKKAVLAEVKGAGCIKHIWFTVSCEDKNYLRKVILRIYWDGEDDPSVETPLGDFFGVGHAEPHRKFPPLLPVDKRLPIERYKAVPK